MDGARVFNAAAASGRPVSEIVSRVDTVMVCLSKALGAPAGSMLAGPRDLIDRGRLLRKRLGGGMRQAGVLAAAGLIALEEMPAHLPVDHEKAKYIAKRLSEIDGVNVFPVETNIVIFDVSETGLIPREISAALKSRGVLINPVNDRLMRAVTHHDVTREQCAEAMDAIAELAAQPA
jgi:threonine aldolase